MPENRDYTLLVARLILNALLVVLIVFLLGEVALSESSIIALLIGQIYAIVCYDESDRRFAIYSFAFVVACFFMVECTPFLAISFIYTRHLRGSVLLALAVLAYLLVNKYFDLLFISFILVALSAIFAYLAQRYQHFRLVYEKQRDQAHETAHLYHSREDQIKQLIDSKSQASVLAERNRIAGELHDHIGHTISSAIVQAEAYKALYLSDQQGAAAPLDDKNRAVDSLVKTLKDGMYQIRTSLHHLRDQSLDLKRALAALRDQYPGLKLSFYLYKTAPMPYDMKRKLLRVAAEIVANAVNHSDATQLKISIVLQNGFYSLIAKDNGRQPPEQLKCGMGLDNMRAIAGEYGGDFNYGYQNGFYIQMTLYLSEAL